MAQFYNLIIAFCFFVFSTLTTKAQQSNISPEEHQQMLRSFELDNPQLLDNQLPAPLPRNENAPFRTQNIASVYNPNFIFPLGPNLYTLCIGEIIRITALGQPNNSPVGYFRDSADASSWVFISRAGYLFEAFDRDTVFYVAQLSEDLVQYGPRKRIRVRIVSTPPILTNIDTLNVCATADARLFINNPAGYLIEASGVVNTTTRGNFITIPAGTPRGYIRLTYLDVSCGEPIRVFIEPSSAARDITPSSKIFCEQFDSLLLFTRSATQLRLFYPQDTINPALTIDNGTKVPPSFFRVADTLMYVQAFFQGCFGPKVKFPYVVVRPRINAGPDGEACINTPYRLNALPLLRNYVGQWESPSSAAIIADRSNPNSIITFSEPGNFSLIWKVTVPGCGDLTDIVSLEVPNRSPIVADDAFFKCPNDIEIKYLSTNNEGIRVEFLSANGAVIGNRLVSTGKFTIEQALARDVSQVRLSYATPSVCPIPDKIIQLNSVPNIQFGGVREYKVCQTSFYSILGYLRSSGRFPLSAFKIRILNDNNARAELSNNNLVFFNLTAGKSYEVEVTYALVPCDTLKDLFNYSVLKIPATPPQSNLFSCESELEVNINLPANANGIEIYKSGVLVGNSSNGNFLARLIPGENKYSIRVTSGCGASILQNFSIFNLDLNQIFTRLRDTTLNFGDTITLGNLPVPNGLTLRWYWNNTDSASSYPLRWISYKPTRLIFTAGGRNCTYMDTIFVNTLYNIKLPNTFTPNDNNLNDTWGLPVIFAETKISIAIYNKQGEPVFSNSDNNNRWDGKLPNGNPAPQDTYFYSIVLQESNTTLRGFINLIR